MLDVLALLLRAWEEHQDAYGWLIIKEVRRPGPVVYAAIDRLEDAGWIAGTWEQLEAGERRPRRRYYTLTAAGVEAARERAVAPAPASVRPLRPRLAFEGLG